MKIKYGAGGMGVSGRGLGGISLGGSGNTANKWIVRRYYAFADECKRATAAIALRRNVGASALRRRAALMVRIYPSLSISFSIYLLPSLPPFFLPPHTLLPLRRRPSRTSTPFLLYQPSTTVVLLTTFMLYLFTRTPIVSRAATLDSTACGTVILWSTNQRPISLISVSIPV